MKNCCGSCQVNFSSLFQSVRLINILTQVTRTCEVLESLGLQELLTLECLAREFQVKTITLPTIINGQKVRWDIRCFEP